MTRWISPMRCGQGRSRWRGAAAVLLAAAAAGCATSPPMQPSPPPFEVGERVEAFAGEPVTWGGMIVEARNLPAHSEIELIAFPLDREGRPISRELDLGRFVAVEAGFLDPALYAPGRFVTLTGRVTGERRGQVRNAPYVWPEVDIERLQLWRPGFEADRGPRFSIGIGIGF